MRARVVIALCACVPSALPGQTAVAVSAAEVLDQTLRSYESQSSTLETTRGRGVNRRGFGWTDEDERIELIFEYSQLNTNAQR